MERAAGRMVLRGVVGLVLLLLWAGGARFCLAHPANIPAATAQIRPDRTFEVRVRFDILAFLLEETSFRAGDEPMNALLDGPVEELQNRLTEAEKRFREELTVSGDAGMATIDSIAFPTVSDIVQWRDSGVSPRLPVMASVTVRGQLPPGATTVSFRFSDLLGTVVLTTELPYREPVSEPLDPGVASTPLPLPGPEEIARARATMLAPRPKATPTPAPSPRPIATRVASPSPIPEPSPSVSVSPAPCPSASPTPVLHPVQPAVSSRPFVRPVAVAPPVPIHVAPRLTWPVTVGRFVKLGYRHILPEGVDHILFVVGLFLLSKKIKPLLAQVSVFTIAHSLTLALALYGVVRLPTSVVEPIIAASIAFVAIENLFATEMKPWRLAIVFAFGLIHGLGFAGALQDLALAKRELLPALLGFNGGVELGQLTVVALALLAVWRLRTRSYYRARVVIPGSLVIAAVALVWFFQRLGLF